jgi:hypothetical protein
MAGGHGSTTGSGATDPLLQRTTLDKTNSLKYTTKAYEQEALRLVIRESNKVAEQLQLHESLPIMESNVTHHYIAPFGTSKTVKAIGNIATTNYAYYVSVDYKFSFLEELHHTRDLLRWSRRCWQPISQLDTNGAYQLAARWLKAVSMDVESLNSDCNLHVRPADIKGLGTNACFLPVYWVYWTRGEEGHGSVASVELFAPTKTLLQLRVEDSDYILRQRVRFTNLDLLLSGSSKP